MEEIDARIFFILYTSSYPHPHFCSLVHLCHDKLGGLISHLQSFVVCKKGTLPEVWKRGVVLNLPFIFQAGGTFPLHDERKGHKHIKNFLSALVLATTLRIIIV